MERDGSNSGEGQYFGRPDRDAQTLKQACQALLDGKLIILPTETVYGLAADATNALAVSAIFKAKGRPSFNPLISHVADLDMAKALGVLDERACALAEAFWPGPLTLVVPVQPDCRCCDLARAGLDTVALRMPAHPVALAVIKAFGRPIAAPSANRSGRPSPTTLADAMEETGPSASQALDGGPCQIGLESTVVAVLPGEKVRWLRPGGITRQQIEAVVGPLAPSDDQGHRSPGRLTLHYAPDAPVRLEVRSPDPGEAWIGFGPECQSQFNLSSTADLSEAAANLFSMLRAADRTRPSAICIAPIPHEGLGEAINDRLRRAAGYIG
jgi:L-threonylcarbamoyladenylate synthase